MSDPQLCSLASDLVSTSDPVSNKLSPRTGYVHVTIRMQLEVDARVRKVSKDKAGVFLSNNNKLKASAISPDAGRSGILDSR